MKRVSARRGGSGAVSRTQTSGRRGRTLSSAQLDRLIAAATVDAYGESEQRTGFLTMMEDNLKLPFKTMLLGVPVLVERVDLSEADEVVAICRRGRSLQAVPILELPLPPLPPPGAEWIEAYRRWACGM
ncbi:MAG: calcium-binding protein [Tepidiformaceae bacterium]